MTEDQIKVHGAIYDTCVNKSPSAFLLERMTDDEIFIPAVTYANEIAVCLICATGTGLCMSYHVPAAHTALPQGT